MIHIFIGKIYHAAACSCTAALYLWTCLWQVTRTHRVNWTMSSLWNSARHEGSPLRTSLSCPAHSFFQSPWSDKCNVGGRGRRFLETQGGPAPPSGTMSVELFVLSFSFLKVHFIFIYVHVCVYHTCAGTCGGQRSEPHPLVAVGQLMWECARTKLRSSAGAASTPNAGCWGISPVHLVFWVCDCECECECVTVWVWVWVCMCVHVTVCECESVSAWLYEWVWVNVYTLFTCYK